MVNMLQGTGEMVCSKSAEILELLSPLGCFGDKCVPVCWAGGSPPAGAVSTGCTVALPQLLLLLLLLLIPLWSILCFSFVFFWLFKPTSFPLSLCNLNVLLHFHLLIQIQSRAGLCLAALPWAWSTISLLGIWKCLSQPRTHGCTYNHGSWAVKCSLIKLIEEDENMQMISTQREHLESRKKSSSENWELQRKLSRDELL